MKIAVIQMAVGLDKGENVKRAVDFVHKAAKAGAQVAVLPEMFCCPYSNEYFADYAESEGEMVHSALSQAAKENGIILFGGTFPERAGEAIYNTGFVFDEKGSQIARCRKTHLFDIDVKGGQRFFESETFQAGSDCIVFDTSAGRFGLCICFDMRFPELARIMALEGAQVIVVPAAFNMTTGPAHWELLFRQRAVDNQLYTLGVSPARDEEGCYVSYANSILCGPWGDIRYRAGADECMALVEIDLGDIQSIRAQLPLIPARRDDVYQIGRAK